MQIFLINRDIIQSKIDSVPVNVYFTDLSSRYLMVNRMFELFIEFAREKLLYKSPYEIFSPETVSRFYIQNAQVLEKGGPIIFEETVSFSRGEEIALLTTKFPVMDERGKTYTIGGITTHITRQDYTEDDREVLINELSDMLLEIKSSNSIVPICSSCKNIRDDHGQWKEIEVNICSYYYNIDFSHGLCPVCAKEYYPKYCR